MARILINIPFKLRLLKCIFISVHISPVLQRDRGLFVRHPHGDAARAVSRWDQRGGGDQADRGRTDRRAQGVSEAQDQASRAHEFRPDRAR